MLTEKVLIVDPTKPSNSSKCPLHKTHVSEPLEQPIPPTQVNFILHKMQSVYFKALGSTT